jgi:hypothetical protein
MAGSAGGVRQLEDRLSPVSPLVTGLRQRGIWDADPDWEWHSAADDTTGQLMTLWQDAVARSRSAVPEALAHGGLDRLARFTTSRGESPSLRVSWST